MTPVSTENRSEVVVEMVMVGFTNLLMKQLVVLIKIIS